MQKKFPEIQTERCLLRKIVDSDIENIFRGLSHPEVIKYYGVSYQTLEATQAQMKFYADLEANETGVTWAICNTDNSIFYGVVGVYHISKEHKKAELGFWLLPEFWGKGILVEVMPFVYEYVFNTLGIHRIEAFVETENVNSKRLMQKINFRHEGTMQDCEIKNGKYISLDIYARFNC
jgi:[ribosomal protein S5]-alanine N-acetyltransferase